MQTAGMDAKIAEALQVVRRLEESSLAKSPLGEMSTWVASGQGAAAEVLREAGFRQDPADPQRVYELRLARKAFVRTWGFSIPCSEAVAALRQLQPLLEIGAGTGYWSALLTSAGHDVVATDAVASGDVGYGFSAATYAAIEALEAQAAVLRYPDRDLFCSWPTKGADWALKAAAALRPGRAFALIGGSETGSPETDDYFRSNFDVLSNVVIPQFPRCNDSLVVYLKR